MADILIRIEKPKNCFLCRFFREVKDYDGTFACCMAAKKEIDWDFDGCFFPTLPEGHGRLIDADALYEVAKTRSMGIYGPCNAQCVITGNDILKSPTIVPAEGGTGNV